MRHMRQVRRWAGVAGLIVVLAGCTYHTALQRLAPEEQTTFRTYRNVMSTRQAHTYLAKATAAERAAYLEEIGLTQRFQAMSLLDRETVLAGFPRRGMSAEALRFLWGKPHFTEGPSGRYERWQYLGSAFSLVENGNSYTQRGTIMTVYLENGQVEGWLETVPAPVETEGGDKRRQ